jgi:hypothetical protein
MNRLIATIAQKMPDFDRNFLRKAAISLCVGIFLLSVTACSGVDAKGKVNAPTSADNMPTTGKITPLYKPIQPPEGGMNNYSDVDPRMNSSEANAKAQREIEKTKDLQKGDTNPLKQLRNQFDDKGAGDRAKEFSKDASQAAKENAKDFAKGTERGFENLKKNAKDFKGGVEDTIDNATQNLPGNSDKM